MLTISYNSFSLTRGFNENPSFVSRIKEVYSAPNISTQSEIAATRHGSKMLNRYFTQKIIRIEGTVMANSLQALQTAIDAMQKAFLTTEGNLDIGYQAATRRYVATPTSVSFPHTGMNAMTIAFEVDFLCSFPFAKSLVDDVFAHTGIITTPNNFTNVFNGTAPLKPIFTITIISETNMSQIELIYTQKSQSVILAPATFTAGDVFIINTLTGNVTQGGNDIEFTGFFPEYDPGSGTTRLIVTDTGAFEVDLEIRSTPYYL